jgi:hypothetical protein
VSYRIEPVKIPPVYGPTYYYLNVLWLGGAIGLAGFVTLPLAVSEFGGMGKYMGFAVGLLIGYWLVRWKSLQDVKAFQEAKRRNHAAALVNNDNTDHKTLSEIMDEWQHIETFRFAIKSHPNWKEER